MAVGRRLCRLLIMPTCDVLAWAVGMGLAVAGRFDWHLDAVDPGGVVPIALVAGLLQVGIGSATHLYRHRHQLGSTHEAALLAGVVVSTGVTVTIINMIAAPTSVPRSVPMIAAVATLVLVAGLRLAVRARRDAARRPDPASALRVVVYGAGRTGAQLVRSMMEDPDSGHRPVALLDDDPQLRHQRIYNVPVLGSGRTS